MINTPVKHLEERMSTIHPGLQFLIFAGVFLVVLIIGNLIGLGIVVALYGLKIVGAITTMSASDPHLVTSLWIIQIIGTTFTIFVAAVFFAYIIVREPKTYLKTNVRFPWLLIALIFVITLLSQPLIELLTAFNQRLQLPHFLNSLQKWIEETEKAAEATTMLLLQMKTIWDMLWRLLVIGLLTAIGEEFMFRGVLQTIFERWTKSVHASIWITAILFSAIHMEFFGFLPRMMLGVLFGYFVAWSGSIWTSVWAHFINNGTAVVALYLYQQKTIKVNPDDVHTLSAPAYLFLLAIVLFLLYLYQKKSFEKNQIPETDGEELG
jgi:membrane protease YdiL (CAAX protease family)